MKILAIGDIHGRDVWKSAPFDEYDKIIFVGDYVDNRKISNAEILRNFNEILNKKTENEGKIELILGNHDIQYLFYPESQCTGFNEALQMDLTDLFLKNSHFFKAAAQFGNYLFTHAGVSKSWYSENIDFFKDKNTSLSAVLNDMLWDKNGRKALTQCSQLRGGRNKFGGIFWADKRETQYDFLDDFHQVIGHTRVPEIITLNITRTQSSITYIDVLEITNQFHIIEI